MTDFRSAPLGDRHVLDRFRCGQVSLDRWLVEHALRAQQQGTARTTVWTASGSDEVMAYYSLAPTEVAKADLTSRLAGGSSRVPGYLLARLALHTSLHGQGLGGQLLLDAVVTICAAADRTGGRLIVADPIDERARAFYLRYGFTGIDKSERLFMVISRARASLERP